MITRLFNHPRIINQTADEQHGIHEQAIGISTDNGGVIVMVQEGREIIVNCATVPDLCKALREQVSLAKSKDGDK